LTLLAVTTLIASLVLSLSFAAQAQPPAAQGPGQVSVIISIEGLRIPAVQVELRDLTANVVVARTVADAIGQVTFPDVPAGRYVVQASREGFADVESAPFDVRAGFTEQVLIEMRLTFVRESVEVILPANSPTESLQPVAVSDLLTGAKMDIQPLAGDDFQSLLTVLPAIVRGPDGRLRLKGGGPTTGALQVSSASLNDPSTGDFDLELPSGALESVEVLSNPFAAEYGRFSTSVTQVSTRRGSNEWVFKPGNLMPNFGRGIIDRFEPRLAWSGPLKRDRLLFGQYFQYRYARTPVKSLPGEPELGLTSFDSYTRLDAVISSRHALTGGVIYFPRRITNATLSTFRPPEATPKFTQEGFSAGIVDRLILTDRMVLEATVAGRTFEVDQKTNGDRVMVYSPQMQSGTFFNSQERHVRSLQIIGALTIAQDRWRYGQHVFKIGVDVQRSSFDGLSASRGLDIVRMDGSLAERTTYRQVVPRQEVDGTELAGFIQDRWRVNDRLSLELGLRADREAITEKINVSPRAGVAISVLPEGRAILRGGLGKFVERTPLTVGAFTQYETATVQRFAASGAPLGNPVTLAHVIDGTLLSPESLVQTAAWDQRFGRKVFFKAAFVHRTGSHGHILNPDPARGALVLSSTGESEYWELETTGRYLASERRDVTVSYVRSHSTGDLNAYDHFFGNFRDPIVRANEHSLSPTDVPHRWIVRGSLGLPGSWTFSPLYEWRTGFPWSAVDEFQDFLGPRNRSGRLPRVSTFDFTLTRPFRFKKHRFTAGLRVFNAFGTGDERDIQANVTAPDYGTFYNPIQRSIGIVLSAGFP
jgi:outer membrane receptor protein involved in Fe transport